MGSKSKSEPGVKKNKKNLEKQSNKIVVQAPSKKKKKHSKHLDFGNEIERLNTSTPISAMQRVEVKNVLRRGSIPTGAENTKTPSGKGTKRQKVEKKGLKKERKSDSDSDSSSSDTSIGRTLKKQNSFSSSDSDSDSSSSEESDSDSSLDKKAIKKSKKQVEDSTLSTKSSGKAMSLALSQKLIKNSEKKKMVTSESKNSKKKQSTNEKKIYSSSHEEAEEENNQHELSLKSESGKHLEDKQSGIDEKQVVGKTNTDCFLEGWSKEEYFELVNKMELAIPKNDTLKYNSRVEKLNWEQVKFDPYTAEECKERWKSIEKRLRGYRILEELLVDAKDWIEKPWTDFYRSGKKNRHPDLPKKPLTSYMLFYMEKKEKYAKKNPGLEMTRLSKLIAEKYKNLPQKKRDKYNAKASNLREEYTEKMQKFLQEHPVEALRISRAAASTTKKGTPTMPGPMKPVPPFKLFLEDKLKQHKSDPNFHSTEFMHECKNKWKSMSSKKKMPWIRWAHENEVKYLEEIKLYQAENTNFKVPPFKSVLSKEEKTILDRMQGKPEKPPNSAYSLFSRVMLKDDGLRTKYDTPKARMQEIAKLWKSLPKVDKDMYAEEVKRMIDSYKMEYATYLDSLSEEQREEELANNVPKRKAKTNKSLVPAKKLKQVKIREIINESQASGTKANKIPVGTELFAQEPPHPPAEPFLLFQEEVMKDCQNNEKKVKKAWLALSDEERENYKLRLENLKQKFFIDYRVFLTSLNPEELKLYSSYRANATENNEKDEDEESSESDDSENSSSDSSSEDDSDDDDDDDDDGNENGAQVTTNLKKEDVAKKKVSSDSSSSSSAEDSDSD